MSKTFNLAVVLWLRTLIDTSGFIQIPLFFASQLERKSEFHGRRQGKLKHGNMSWPMYFIILQKNISISRWHNIRSCTSHFIEYKLLRTLRTTAADNGTDIIISRS